MQESIKSGVQKLEMLLIANLFETESKLNLGLIVRVVFEDSM